MPPDSGGDSRRVTLNVGACSYSARTARTQVGRFRAAHKAERKQGQVPRRPAETAGRWAKHRRLVSPPSASLHPTDVEGKPLPWRKDLERSLSRLRALPALVTRDVWMTLEDVVRSEGSGHRSPGPVCFPLCEASGRARSQRQREAARGRGGGGWNGESLDGDRGAAWGDKNSSGPDGGGGGTTVWVLNATELQWLTAVTTATFMGLFLQHTNIF